MIMTTQKSDTEILLGDLCAICHVNAIKYTCPRCSIHTCSLPCVKRHKQWAQCSGVRNPAEYRKRVDLATPSSIDKDFNFITHVERTIQRADTNTLDRGLNLVPARTRPTQHGQKSRLELEAESRNIKIIKLPKALSRNKSNKTHWATAAKCIQWTIEWVLPDGEKKFSGTHESKTVGEAYNAAFARKGALKRKHNEEEVAQHKPPPETGVASHSSSEQRRTETALSQPTSRSSTGTLPRDYHFYLHRPNTEARYKVLIPIQSDEPLRGILNNITLMEFPTIIIRTESPAELQPPYMTEEEYLKRHGQDIPINVTAPAPLLVAEKELEEGEVDGHEVDAQATSADDLDESRVLEVIAKDLGG